MNTADKQPRDGQTRYKKHFNARLRHITSNLMLEDLAFVVAMLVGQPHKLEPVATGSFSVVAADTHTVTIKRPEICVEKRSCKRVVKTTSLRTDPISKAPRPIGNYFRILDLAARRQSCSLAFHGFDLKKRSLQATCLLILTPRLTIQPCCYMM